jgi:hypothetical protein
MERYLLYSNGQLSVDMWGENKAWTSGLRPNAVVSVRDAEARRIFCSEVLTGRTFCSRTDPTCASSGSAGHWDLQFPLEIGQYAVGVDVSNWDGPSNSGIRNIMCAGIRAAAEKDTKIPQDLKQAILDGLRC